MPGESQSSLHDAKEIRCPRLGNQILFAYCRVENLGKPCPRALICWTPFFNASDFFSETMTEEEFNSCFQVQTPPKMVSLIELIEKAKANAARSDTRD